MQIRIAAVALMLALAGTAYAQDHAAPSKADEPKPAQAAAPKKDKAVDDKAEEPKLTLFVGDKAPALSINKWVKGEPVTGFEKGKVYVVEFWATWCGPCRKSIPHLTEIQASMKDKGVTVIGISSQERKGLEDVEPFVTKMGDKMAYTVAFDEKGQTSKAWMDASGQQGIPTSFIVAQDGRIAWIGHPMDGLDAVLAKVVAKTFDIDKAAADAKKKAEIDAKARPLIEQAQEAFQSGDHKKALETLDKLIALDPVSMGEWGFYKVQLLAVEMKDYDKAYKYGAELVAGPLKDNAQVLNAMAWMIVDESSLEKRDLPLAKRAAERANELTGGKDPAIMDTYAKALFDSGDTEKAIQIQTKAVEIAPEGAMKDELKDRLDEYQKKVKKG